MEKLLAYLKSLDDVQRADFAKRCDTTVQYLFQIAWGNRPNPKVKLVVDIERESGGRVKVEDLLPEVDWKYLLKKRAA
jgi:DNA-binding transcriptional regulator YdaS (Cro superfamily)